MMASDIIYIIAHVMDPQNASEWITFAVEQSVTLLTSWVFFAALVVALGATVFRTETRQLLESFASRGGRAGPIELNPVAVSPTAEERAQVDEETVQGFRQNIDDPTIADRVERLSAQSPAAVFDALADDERFQIERIASVTRRYLAEARRLGEDLDAPAAPLRLSYKSATAGGLQSEPDAILYLETNADTWFAGAIVHGPQDFELPRFPYERWLAAAALLREQGESISREPITRREFELCSRARLAYTIPPEPQGTR